MSKPAIVAIIGIVIAVLAGVLLIKYKQSRPLPESSEETALDLPINTLPISDRPFITLAPDATGRSLDISVSGAPREGSMEYELVYQASGKQEGALGMLLLDSEIQPITKSILLGSKSGGGKVTYHEGVTGGSLTVTYGISEDGMSGTRLKESWNFLTFDPADPVLSSTDGRFAVTLPKTALKKDARVVTLKTFGLPAPVPAGNLVAGPYGYYTVTPIKGAVTIELKLPAGQHTNPTLYAWEGKAWTKLKATLSADSLSAPTTGSVFIVTTD